jgi:hypothetical protein
MKLLTDDPIYRHRVIQVMHAFNKDEVRKVITKCVAPLTGRAIFDSFLFMVEVGEEYYVYKNILGDRDMWIDRDQAIELIGKVEEFLSTYGAFEPGDFVVNRNNCAPVYRVIKVFDDRPDVMLIGNRDEPGMEAPMNSYREATEAQYSIPLVKALREKSGCGLIDCKKALKATDYDFDAAFDYVKKHNSLSIILSK